MNPDTLQTVHAAFMPVYWKFFLIGFVGFLLHITKQLYDKNIQENSIAQYWADRKWEIVWGLLSYQILIWLWHSGDIFVAINWIPYFDDIKPIPLNMGTVFVGYFSSSIMAGVLGLIEKLGDKVRALTEKKIDNLPDKKP